MEDLNLEGSNTFYLMLNRVRLGVEDLNLEGSNTNNSPNPMYGFGVEDLNLEGSNTRRSGILSVPFRCGRPQFGG